MNNDEKLEARKNDYHSCKFNILEQRENNGLSLRKEKINDYINKKRLKTQQNMSKTYFSENKIFQFRVDPSNIEESRIYIVN